MTAITQLTSGLSDRYAIDREIGRGGMATVYLARDVKHDRRVALKVLNPELGAVPFVELRLHPGKLRAGPRAAAVRQTQRSHSGAPACPARFDRRQQSLAFRTDEAEAQVVTIYNWRAELRARMRVTGR